VEEEILEDEYGNGFQREVEILKKVKAIIKNIEIKYGADMDAS
jgi:hypothetical protein